MKEYGLLFAKKAILWLPCFSSLIFFFNCVEIDFEDSNGSDDNAEGQAVTVVEYDWMNGFDMGNDGRVQPELRDNPERAFMDAGIEFHPERDNNNSPVPSWQSYSGTNQFFPDSDTQLRDYAQFYKNFDIDYAAWHFFSVDRYQNNQNPANPLALGRANNSPQNAPGQPPSERYAFVFWADMQDKYSDLDELKLFAVTVSTHELGHQRAGLTEFQTYPQFHNAVIDNDNDFLSDCVMNSIEALLQPIFCYDTPQPDNNPDNSCVDNLAKHIN